MTTILTGNNLRDGRFAVAHGFRGLQPIMVAAVVRMWWMLFVLLGTRMQKAMELWSR